jgi:hypothetical protein
MHSSVKANYKIDPSIPLAGYSDDDQDQDPDKDKDPDFKSPNSKRSKKSRRSISNSEISRPSTRSSTSQTKCSIFISPPQPKLLFSKQETSLNMPSFDQVESFDVWSGKYAYLGGGRCGTVFMGAVNGKKVAVKVTIFILIFFLIIKYVILFCLSFYYNII